MRSGLSVLGLLGLVLFGGQSGAVSVSATSGEGVSPFECKARHEPMDAKLGVKDPFRDFVELASKKRRKWALFCGCGPSMNLIDAARATYLEKHFDVWATNQFFLHAYVTPRFMHIELKAQSAKTLADFFDETKERQYANTTFLTGYKNNKEPFRVLYERVRHDNLFVYDYFSDLKWSKLMGCSANDGFHHPQRCGPTDFKCSASITIVFQYVALLRYEAVWLLGVDLVMHEHFWNDNPLYSAAIRGYAPPVARDADKSYETDVTSPQGGKVHATARRGVHLYLEAYLRFNGITAVNLSPHSAPLFGGIANGTVENLVRCSDRGLDGQALHDCVIFGYH